MSGESGHEMVSGLAVDPENTRLFTGDSVGNVKIWDIEWCVTPPHPRASFPEKYLLPLLFLTLSLIICVYVGNVKIWDIEWYEASISSF